MRNSTISQTNQFYVFNLAQPGRAKPRQQPRCCQPGHQGRCRAAREDLDQGLRAFLTGLGLGLAGSDSCGCLSEALLEWAQDPPLNYPGELQKGETKAFPGQGQVSWTGRTARASFTDPQGRPQQLTVEGNQLRIGNKTIHLRKTGAIVSLQTSDGPVQFVVGSQGHGANREISRVAVYGPGEQIQTSPPGATEHLSL